MGTDPLRLFSVAQALPVFTAASIHSQRFVVLPTVNRCFVATGRFVYHFPLQCDSTDRSVAVLTCVEHRTEIMHLSAQADAAGHVWLATVDALGRGQVTVLPPFGAAPSGDQKRRRVAPGTAVDPAEGHLADDSVPLAVYALASPPLDSEYPTLRYGDEHHPISAEPGVAEAPAAAAAAAAVTAPTLPSASASAGFTPSFGWSGIYLRPGLDDPAAPPRCVTIHQAAGVVTLWEADRPLMRVYTCGAPCAGCWSADGATFLVCDESALVQYNFTSRQPLNRCVPAGGRRLHAVSQEGSLLAVGSADRTVFMVDLRRWTVGSRWPGIVPHTLNRVHVRPDGGVLVTALDNVACGVQRVGDRGRLLRAMGRWIGLCGTYGMTDAGVVYNLEMLCSSDAERRPDDILHGGDDGDGDDDDDV